ncbi:MAG: deoxyguanosinetriphosphate triphosphohydrolase [Clostridia bacterium]|nr:deoxyguanosinetriphosphate triphosphohydrolase [Clostridia bacterium]
MKVLKSISDMTLMNEELTLSDRACKSKDTKGRLFPEEEDGIRTAFQRDRDRIIHCNAFRRLQHKTQVFLSPTGDHYRTRLTHTLEVAQIARTLAMGLGLNEDLTEAIALGHDLGHTPFGHAGERALDAVVPFGFKHYEQSLRVVDVIEKDGKGLNLTMEVRDGIVCHTTGKEADTLEGRLVKHADRIAYLNHDIDDAIRAGVLTEEALPAHIREVLGKSKGDRINTLVQSTLENTMGLDVTMAPEVQKAYDELYDFMFDNVYRNPVCKGEEGKAIVVVQELYRYFVEHPEEMPEDYRHIAQKESPERGACDYISGMSDRYALAVFEELFIPKPWAE